MELFADLAEGLGGSGKGLAGFCAGHDTYRVYGFFLNSILLH